MLATPSAPKHWPEFDWSFLGESHRTLKKGSIVESLYREIRTLRIDEGATEVQQLIIRRNILRSV